MISLDRYKAPLTSPAYPLAAAEAILDLTCETGEATGSSLPGVCGALAAAAVAAERVQEADPYEQEFQELLADPAVHAKLAMLQPGTVVQIGQEKVPMNKTVLEDIVGKHIHLTAHELRRRALTHPDHPHPDRTWLSPSLADGTFSVAERLTEGFYGQCENLWIAVLPASEGLLKTAYRGRIEQTDANHAARLCVAVDLKRGGVPPVTNLVDMVVGVRETPQGGWSRVVVLARTTPYAGKGPDYLKLDPEVVTSPELSQQLERIKLGDMPWRPRRRRAK